jgi:predicted anti-sigma-YlaC factor YlaD
MTLRCPDPSVLRSPDALVGDERARVLRHLVECGSCRQLYVADDPSRLFALLAFTPIPAETLEAVSAGISDRMSGSEPRPRRLALAAGWAAAAVLGVLTARTLFDPMRPTGRGGLDSVAVQHPRADVEVFSPADERQVVDLTVGDSQVVMIFDERLRL